MLDVVARPVDGTGPIRLRADGPIVTAFSQAGEDTDVWISPGFLDIQVNGYSGRDVRAVDVDADTISGLVRSLWPYGITALCPTVTTGPEQRMINSLRAIAAARSADPLIARAIPCIHVEGPHLSKQDGPRGAHNADYVRPPDLEEFNRWQRACDGAVGVVTVAPELPGAADYIHMVTNAGTVVALGHTAAEPEDIARGVHSGARLATHLGNGAHAVLRRHPNYIWEQLADKRLMASFIADGQHLSASTFSAMVRAKGYQRSILISDAVALGGSPEGSYDGPTGSKLSVGRDGHVRLAGTSLLAGGARAQSECLAWTVFTAELPLPQAVAMAATNPARLLHCFTAPRVIQTGGAADFTLFRLDDANQRLDIVATIVGGVVVYRSTDSDVAVLSP